MRLADISPTTSSDTGNRGDDLSAPRHSHADVVVDLAQDEEVHQMQSIHVGQMGNSGPSRVSGLCTKKTTPGSLAT